MELHSCINYLLNVSQHEVSKRFSEELARYDVTPGQYGVLSCLWQNGSCTPREIAQTLRLENSTISGILDRMQKQGLIDREMAPEDRRSVRVVPTAEGMAMKNAVLKTVEELNERYSAEFAPEQWKRLVAALQKVGKVEQPEEDQA